MERNAALVHVQAPGDFCAAKPAGDGDFDAFPACLEGALQCLLHGTSVRNPALQLVGYGPGNQTCIEFRLLDLFDVQLYAFAYDLLEVRARLFDTLTAAANHDTGSGGMNRGDHLIRLSFDIDR
jgi:hypothetical protein